MAKVIDLIAENIQRRTRHINQVNIAIFKKSLPEILETAHQEGALTADGKDLSDKGVNISIAIASFLNRRVLVNGETFQLAEFLVKNKVDILEKIDIAIGRKPRTISAPPAPIPQTQPVVEPLTASQPITSTAPAPVTEPVITSQSMLSSSSPVTIVKNRFRGFTDIFSSSAPAPAIIAQAVASTPPVTIPQTESTSPESTDSNKIILERTWGWTR
jgi:hypothetical protein